MIDAPQKWTMAGNAPEDGEGDADVALQTKPKTKRPPDGRTDELIVRQ